MTYYYVLFVDDLLLLCWTDLLSVCLFFTCSPMLSASVEFISLFYDGVVLLNFLEVFEDTKGAIRIVYQRKTDNTMAKRKKYKRTNNKQQNTHIQLKIE